MYVFFNNFKSWKAFQFYNFNKRIICDEPLKSVYSVIFSNTILRSCGTAKYSDNVVFFWFIIISLCWNTFRNHKIEFIYYYKEMQSSFINFVKVFKGCLPPTRYKWEFFCTLFLRYFFQRNWKRKLNAKNVQKTKFAYKMKRKRVIKKWIDNLLIVP